MSGDFVDGGGDAFLQRRPPLPGSTRRSLSRVDALLSMPYVFDSIDRSSLATERKLAAPRFISISAAPRRFRQPSSSARRLGVER